MEFFSKENLGGWKDHELLDSLVMINVKKLVKDISNDMELGKEIRKIIIEKYNIYENKLG